MPETVLQALPVLDLDDPRGADPLRRHIRQLVEAVAEHGRRRKRIDQLEGGGTMAKTDFKSVDQYIASQPAAARAPLGRVRNAIRKAVPGAEEVISYQIPAYKMRGDPVLFFAG